MEAGAGDPEVVPPESPLDPPELDPGALGGGVEGGAEESTPLDVD